MSSDSNLSEAMIRRCSYCSHNGHNSRTCPNGGVKLFGVRLTDGSIGKSASMGNLNHYAGSSSGTHLNGTNNPSSPGDTPDYGMVPDGYASDDFVTGSSSSCRERKKSIPWTGEEHRMFLLGLQKLGKGDWCGIARNYVIFQEHQLKWPAMLRSISSGYTPLVPQDFLSGDYLQEELQCDCLLPAENDNPLLTPPALYKDSESMDSTKLNGGDLLTFKPETLLSYCLILYPAYVSPGFPFPLPFWSGNDNNTDAEPKEEEHEVLKPTAIHSKSPINVDELVGMSKLSLGESIGPSGPSSLSLKLEVSSRQSAFHVNPGSGSSSMNMSVGGSPIHAV